MRPYGIIATTQTGISGSLEKRSVKYLGVIIDKRLNFRKQVGLHKTKTDRKMNLLKVLNSLSDFNARIMKHIATIQLTGVRGSYLRNYGPSNIHSRHITGFPESRDASYPWCTTRKKCQDDETRNSVVTCGTQIQTLPED